MANIARLSEGLREDCGVGCAGCVQDYMTAVHEASPLPLTSPTSHKCVVTVNNCCSRKQTTTRYLRTAEPHLARCSQEMRGVILPRCCEKLPLLVLRSFLHGITHIWCLDSYIIKHTSAWACRACPGLDGLIQQGPPTLT